MKSKDENSIYIHCDGSMKYDSKSSGGIGYIIKFPDWLEIDDIAESIGTYEDSNIERLELEGIIQGMKGFRYFNKKNPVDLSDVNNVIVVTDRYDLQDERRTNPYKIARWRKDKWKNHEAKEIKNHRLLDELDKIRSKIYTETRKSVRIEYRPRKQNREADKLSKKAREIPITNRSVAIEGNKIGRRKFDGGPVAYRRIHPKDYLRIHVYKKQLIQNDWEISVEICDEFRFGQKMKIYTDYTLAEKLNRGNEFIVRIKKSFTHHVTIYRTLKKIKKENHINSDLKPKFT